MRWASILKLNKNLSQATIVDISIRLAREETLLARRSWSLSCKHKFMVYLNFFMQIRRTLPDVLLATMNILYTNYRNTRSVQKSHLFCNNNEEKCDVTLPWQHYFWMTTKPTTTATARRTAKNNMFILTNNNFARASRYFVHFFVVVAPLRHETSRNFTLYGVGEHNTKISAFFFKTQITIDTIQKKMWPRFAKLNEIEKDR